MPTSRNLIIGILAVSAWVCCAYASGVAVTVTPQGAVASSSLTVNPSVASLPSGQSQGLANDVGFAVAGPFTFDTSANTSPSITYSVFEPITLTPGSYEVSTYMSASISDTPESSPTGLDYVKDFQVISNLYTNDSEGVLSGLVASSSAGQLNYPSTGYGTGSAFAFCQLPGCIGLSSGNPPGEGTFTVATTAQYYLQQTFIATVSGVGLNDVITVDLPDTSGVGSDQAPEPGSYGLLAVGMAMLLFARRRAAKVARA
jgi:hypothetical protein